MASSGQARVETFKAFVKKSVSITAADENLGDNECKEFRQEQECIQATNAPMEPTRCAQHPQETNFGLCLRSSCVCIQKDRQEKDCPIAWFEAHRSSFRHGSQSIKVVIGESEQKKIWDEQYETKIRYADKDIIEAEAKMKILCNTMSEKIDKHFLHI